MSKFKFIFSILSLLFFAQIGAISGPPIKSISPFKSDNNARVLNSSPKIIIQIARFATVTDVKFGTVSVPFSQLGTTITIPQGVLPQSAPDTVTVQLVYSNSSTSEPNAPWDYYTYQGNWIIYIPDQSGKIIVADETVSLLAGPPSPYNGASEMVAITPDGKYVYCTNSQGDAALNNLIIIDTATQALSYVTFSDLGITDSEAPFAIVNSPDGNTLVITDPSADQAYKIDVTDRTAPVGGTNAIYSINDPIIADFLHPPTLDGLTPMQLSQIVTSPDSKVAYTTNTAEDSILAIDVASNAQTSISFVNTPSIGGGDVTVGDIHAIAIAPDGASGFAVGKAATEGIVMFNTSAPFDQQFFPVIEAKGLNYGAIAPDPSPIAYATFTVNGQTVDFDAHLSFSPTLTFLGDIAQYEWDFGDSTSLYATSDATVSHTYAPGDYTVKLRVTNEIGTSVDQTYSGRMMFNNGGPKALYEFNVNIASNPPKTQYKGAANDSCDPDLLPPSNVIIKQSCTNSRYMNTLTIFAPSSGPSPTSYLIYLDPNRKNRVKTVDNTGDSVTVKVCACCHGACYYIYSKGANGRSCDYLRVGIHNKKCQ